MKNLHLFRCNFSQIDDVHQATACYLCVSPNFKDENWRSNHEELPTTNQPNFGTRQALAMSGEGLWPIFQGQRKKQVKF